MLEYKLEIKQLVEYPRCRIYRQFIQTLITDKNLHSRGNSHLYHFMVLCSYANFRTSYHRIGGIPYTVYPGEWVCTLSTIKEWFHMRFQYQALEILDYLQTQHYISYVRLGRGKLIKFKIRNWSKINTVLDYNAPCQKSSGFFFFPVAWAEELTQMGKCSKLDIVLDLWLHAVYNDTQVVGSEAGPVVYFRNCTGRPFTSYTEMANRWYYWILYYTYLSPQEMGSVVEIIEMLRPHLKYISYRTYYRYRKEEIETLSSVLGGYSSKNCLGLFDHFFPDR